MAYLEFDGTLDSEESSKSTRTAKGFVEFDGELDKPSSATDRIKDVGVSIAKGAMQVPEAVVGLYDIATGGRAGKFAEEHLGYAPKKWQAGLDAQLTPEQLTANKAVEGADGFVGTLGAVAQNPSVVPHKVLESAGSMVAGGVLGRGVAAAKSLAPWAAGAIGEGVIGAGAAAEGIRQKTDDGLLTPGQSAAAVGTGIGTGVFGAVGGRVAAKLGISDVDTMLAGGAANMTGKGVARRIIEGGITEGVFEEMPQSVQETIWQNAALGRPLLDGVPNSAAMGLVTGAAMGGAAAIRRNKSAPAGLLAEETATIADIGKATSGEEAIEKFVKSVDTPAAKADTSIEDDIDALETTAGMTPTVTGNPVSEQNQALAITSETGNPVLAPSAPVVDTAAPIDLPTEAGNPVSPDVWRFGVDKITPEPVASNNVVYRNQAEADAAVAAGREQQTAAQRLAVMDAVLASDAAVSMTPKQVTKAFTSALTAQGFADANPTTAELARLDRGMAARDAILATEQDDVIPSVPNEMDVAALVPEKKSAAVAATDPLGRVKTLLNQGYTLQGKQLASPTGERVNLSRQELIYAKSNRKGKSNDRNATAVSLPIRDAGNGSVEGDSQELRRPEAGSTPIAQPDTTRPANSASTTSAGGNDLPAADGTADAVPALAQSNPEQTGTTRESSEQATRAQMRAETLASLENMSSKALRQLTQKDKRLYVRAAAADILQTRDAATRQKRSDAMRKIYAKANRIDPEQDSMGAAIARLGGISRESASGRMRLTREELNVRGAGILRIFTSNGRTLDEMGAALAELGYIQRDENGKYDQADFEDKLAEVANGGEVYTPQGIMRRAQEEYDRAAAEVGAQSAEDYAEIEDYADAIEQYADPDAVDALLAAYENDKENDPGEFGPEYYLLNSEDDSDAVVAPLITDEELDGYAEAIERQEADGSAEVDTGRQAGGRAQGAGASTESAGADASAEEGFSLTTQDRADLEAKEARANDQNVADRELADSQRDAFTLSAPPGTVEGEAQAISNNRQEGLFGDAAKFFKQGNPDEQAIADGVIPDTEFASPKPFLRKTDASLFKVKNRLSEVSIVQTNGGWAFNPVSAPLTEAQKEDVRSDVTQLNRALKAAGAEPVKPLFEPPSPQHELARAVAKVFGTTVHFVSDNPVFDGVAHRGIAYLKQGMRRPELAITGHEVFHTLEQSNPKLAEKLLDHVRGYLKEDAVPERQLREELMAGRPVSERYAAGEVLADINGAMWLDPKFWREMIQRDANLFRRVAYLFMENATKAVNSLVGTRFDVAALVTDVDAVRSLIAQTWADHNQGRDVDAESGDVRFSRSQTDMGFAQPPVATGKIKSTGTSPGKGQKALPEMPPGGIKRGSDGYFGASPKDINAKWKEPGTDKLDDVIYFMQDKHVDTKRVVEEIQKTIGSMDDKWNPYDTELLFHGRVKTQIKDFLDGELEPLFEAMTKAGIEQEQLERYLHNRHAKEANEQIARIDPDFPDGGSGIMTKDALNYLRNIPPEERKVLESLAQQVDMITRATTDHLVASGLESKEMIDKWLGAYKHYVPLFRGDADEVMAGVGQGFSVRGSASERRTGGSAKVTNILANIARARENAIVRAEKNRVSLAVYGLSLKAPNPDFWLPINLNKTKEGTLEELQKVGLSAVDAQHLMEMPIIRKVNPRTGIVEETVNSTIKNKDFVLYTRVNGEDRFVIFNQHDERAMRMVMALKNLDTEQITAVLNPTGKLTRYLSITAATRYLGAVNTQYNPVFGIANLTRDTQDMLLNLQSTPLAGKQKEILAAQAGFMNSAKSKTRLMDLDNLTGEYAKLWRQFQVEGGITGFRDMYATSLARQDAITAEIKRMKIKNADWTSKQSALKLAYMAGEALAAYNEAMENVTRLATFKVAIDSGMSPREAALLGKTITVNFNKKGQAASWNGALYMFFNASIQGNVRTFKTLTSKSGKAIIAGGMMWGAAQAILMAMAGLDEDDERFESVKRANSVLPTFGLVGEKGYFTIPMPQGFAPIVNAGRLLTEWALHRGKNPGKYLGRIVENMIDTYFPWGWEGGTALATYAPSVADPFVQLGQNRSSFGGSIYNEKRSIDDVKPGQTRDRAGAGYIGYGLAWAINRITGGDDDVAGSVSPTSDVMDYLVGQVTGGPGRELTKIGAMIKSGVTGEELPTSKMLLASRFYGNKGDQNAVAAVFYDNVHELNEHEARLLGMKARKEGRATIDDYKKDHPEAVLVGRANEAEKQVRRLNKEKRKLIADGASTEKVKLKDMQILSQMKKLNEAVKAATD